MIVEHSALPSLHRFMRGADQSFTATNAESTSSDSQQPSQAEVLPTLTHVLKTYDPDLLGHGDRTARYALTLVEVFAGFAPGVFAEISAASAAG